MQEKIKEVQDYFKNKILSKDFEVEKIEQHYFYLLIDSQYEFIIWIGNFDIPRCTKPISSFIDIDITDEEAIKLHGLLLPIVNKYKKETLLEQKKKELEELQKEVNGLSN
jgi:hypothetical protein